MLSSCLWCLQHTWWHLTLGWLQMQQKNGGQAVNCSYPSDQRGLQGVFPNSTDCGHGGSAKTENQNFQPKVIILSTWRALQCCHVGVMYLIWITSPSRNCCLLYSFVFCPWLYIIVCCYEVHCRSRHSSALKNRVHLFSSHIPSRVGDFSFTRTQRQPFPQSETVNVMRLLEHGGLFIHFFHIFKHLQYTFGKLLHSNWWANVTFHLFLM